VREACSRTLDRRAAYLCRPSAKEERLPTIAPRPPTCLRLSRCSRPASTNHGPLARAQAPNRPAPPALALAACLSPRTPLKLSTAPAGIGPDPGCGCGWQVKTALGLFLIQLRPAKIARDRWEVDHRAQQQWHRDSDPGLPSAERITAWEESSGKDHGAWMPCFFSHSPALERDR